MVPHLLCGATLIDPGLLSRGGGETKNDLVDLQLPPSVQDLCLTSKVICWERFSWQGLSGTAWYSFESGSEQGLPWEPKLASEKPASPFCPGHAGDSYEILWHHSQEPQDSSGKEGSHQFTQGQTLTSKGIYS